MKRRLLPCFGVPAESFSMPLDYGKKKRKKEGQAVLNEKKRQAKADKAAADDKEHGSVAKRTRLNDSPVELLR